MKSIRMAALVAVALVLGCDDKKETSAQTSAPASAPATQSQPAEEALAPSTQPEAVIEAAELFEKLAKSKEYAPAVTVAEQGRVDWSRGLIVATGQAKAEGVDARSRLMAQRAAEVIAKRNALMMAAGGGGVRTGTVSVEGEVASARVLKKEFDEATRTATVSIEAPISGLRGVVRKDEHGLQPQPWKWSVREPVKEKAEIVVIDVRGLDVAPTMTPVLLNEAGELVFSPSAGAASGSVRAFVHVARAASGTPLDFGAFKNVILLTPVKAEGGALILGERDMQTLQRHANARELLRAGRAAVIVKNIATAPPK